MGLPEPVLIIIANFVAVVLLFWIGFEASEGRIPTFLGGQFTGGFLLAGAWLGIVGVFLYFRSGTNA